MIFFWKKQFVELDNFFNVLSNKENNIIKDKLQKLILKISILMTETVRCQSIVVDSMREIE